MKLAEITFMQGEGFAEQADIAKVKRLPVDYKALYEKAFLLEKEAALEMSPEDNHPMFRYEMMQSAAALAYKAGKYDDALKTIALCRTFDPDDYTLMRLNELEALIRKADAGQPKNGSLRITGILTAANGDEKEIRIRDRESMKVYAFVVPAKMFKEVVKSYWLETVAAVAKISPNGALTLQKISPAA